MTKRTEASSKWYIPLVAGTEIVRRDPAIPSRPASDLIGDLPSAPPWAYAGLTIWLDAAAVSSTKIMPSGAIYRWEDQSGNNRYAFQTMEAKQPIITTDIAPRAVDLED